MNEPAASAGRRELGLQDILLTIWNRKILIVAITAVSTVASLLYALWLQPIYRAEVLLAPAGEDGAGGASALASQFEGLGALAGISLWSGSGKKEEALATIQSRALTEAFIKEKNLLPVLFPNAWDANAQKWKASDSEKHPTLWDGEELFRKSVRQVTEIKKTGLLKIAIEWSDPQLAYEWVKELVDRTNNMLRDRAIERSTKNIQYLEGQLAKRSEIEVRQAIYRLLENEMKAAMLAQGNTEFAFKVLDPAVVPQRKVRPRRLMIVLLGAMGGFAAACFLALTVRATPAGG